MRSSTVVLALIATPLFAACSAVASAPATAAANAAARASANAAARASATAAANASALASAPRCPKGTTALGPRRAPTACVPSRRPSLPAALQAGFALGPRAPRGARRPSAKARRATLRALTVVTARARAGEPVFGGARGSAARAARKAGPTAQAAETIPGLGRVVGQREGPDGQLEATIVQDDGVRVTFSGRLRGEGDESFGFEAEARDRSGAGVMFGYGEGPPTPRCPTAAGEVATVVDDAGIAGQAFSSHGKRTWTKVSTRVEGGWQGRVGVGARAERFDVDVRGVTEIRSGVEIAATGKVLRRNATRVYRTTLRKRGLPVGAVGRDVYDAMTFRGPKGRRLEQADLRVMGQLIAETAYVVDSASEELRAGDVRWYDQRACASTRSTHAPERVAKGGRADWDVTAHAADGSPVADARWSPASACGVLTASATSGPAIHLTVVDAAGAWGPRPPAGACATAELTTTAGRPQPFAGEIPPEELERRSATITVRFTKNMGPGITETHMRGSGEVLIGEPGAYADGTGDYTGTEWDGTPENSCGRDMLATRTFAGRAAVGGQLNDDGTISVAFTAPERPFEMAWIVIVPAAGGSETIRASQPFCGEPGRAQTLAEVTVRIRLGIAPVSRTA